jgi:hypothetical protein
VIAASIVLLLVLTVLVDRWGQRRTFRRSLAAKSCPWCSDAYGEVAARFALRDQSASAKAFTIRCARCQRDQILTPGPSIAEWRAKHHLPDDIPHA